MDINIEIADRFDTSAFTMPTEFSSDEETFSKENKLLLCRLFMDSYKLLNYEEFSAFQGTLVVISCWDETARAPKHICGGMFHVYSEMPLSMKIIAKTMNTDMEKLVVLLKCVFKKLPILRTMLPKSLLKEIDEMETLPLRDVATGTIDKENFKKIGPAIRTNLFRTDDGKIAYRKKKSK